MPLTRRNGREADADAVLLLGAEWFGARPGGLNRYFVDLGTALRAEGVGTAALVVGPAEDAPPWVETAGSTTEALPSRLWRFGRAAARLGPPAGTVDAHFALYAAWPVTVGGLRHRRLVVHFQGPWAEESRHAGSTSSRWAPDAKRVVERAVYRRADRVVVLSHAFKRIVVERYGVSPWKVAVIPPGVDLDRFRPGDRQLARDRVGVAVERPVVVAVRRLERRMGLETLLEAWADVCRDHPGALLGIVGEGSIRTELEEQARRLPIPSSVRLLGRLGDSDLAEWYRAADVSVVPSIALEGFGLVVLESLACGTPVVVSDAGGLPEAVNGLGSDLVEPAGDAPAWSRRLARTLAGQAGLPDGDRCRAHAEEFAWKHVVAAHRDVYATAPNHPRRLRVVYVDHCSQLAGAELALAELLANLGEVVDVHVLLGADGPLVDRLLRSGISVEVLAMSESARSLRRQQARLAGLPVGAATAAAADAARLAHRLRRLGPDLVHTNSLKAAYYGGLAGRAAGIPVVWHLHDQLVTDHLPAASVHLTRWLARHLPAGVVANSASTLATLGPIDRPAAVVAPVIVDPGAPPVPAGRRDRRFRVGMVGRLAQWKGQHVFLAAFARAFPAGDVQAVVVGGALFDDCDYEAELKELAHRLDLDDRVEFRGQVDDVAPVLAELEVMVHASVAPEPFGRVIVEAMAAGVAVIASRAGGAAELIDHEVDGLLVPPGDIDALARAMVDLERSADLRVRLATAGLAKARCFSAQPAVDQVVDLYDRVLDARGRVS